MIVFLVYAFPDTAVAGSWGKGKTLTEAFSNMPDKLKRGEKYALAIYEAENIDTIYMTDYMAIARAKEDKQLYHGTETVK